MDLQTEKIRQSKNQRLQLAQPEGPGNFVGARIWLDKSHVTFQSESPGDVHKIFQIETNFICCSSRGGQVLVPAWNVANNITGIK